MTAPLKAFTVCLRAFKELTRPHGLFSVNSSSHGTDIQIFVNHGEFPYSVSVGDQELHFKDLGYASVRKHLCATWESHTGVTQVFFNTNKLARKVVNKGYTIEGPLQITLGKKKDSHGGSFNIKHFFVGEIGDVHVWDSVKPPGHIYQAFINNPYTTGNVINWQDLRYETKGNVLVLPAQ